MLRIGIPLLGDTIQNPFPMILLQHISSKKSRGFEKFFSFNYCPAPNPTNKDLISRDPTNKKRANKRRRPTAPRSKFSILSSIPTQASFLSVCYLYEQLSVNCCCKGFFLILIILYHKNSNLSRGSEKNFSFNNCARLISFYWLNFKLFRIKLKY